MSLNQAEEGDRIYAASGNTALIDLLHYPIARVLDVGCGTGGNASLIKARFPNSEIYGITHSTAEANLAGRYMNRCWVGDIENELPQDLVGEKFDALIFSHVLEHTRHPAIVLAKCVNLLTQGGQVLIAVPNVLSWRMRKEFLLGRFEYQSGGVLDDTHLRFFTYYTADKELLKDSPSLQIEVKYADGNIPLWWLRRYVLPVRWAAAIDRLGCKLWPNLFGWQILIRAIKL